MCLRIQSTASLFNRGVPLNWFHCVYRAVYDVRRCICVFMMTQPSHKGDPMAYLLGLVFEVYCDVCIIWHNETATVLHCWRSPILGLLVPRSVYTVMHTLQRITWLVSFRHFLSELFFCPEHVPVSEAVRDYRHIIATVLYSLHHWYTFFKVESLQSWGVFGLSVRALLRCHLHACMWLCWMWSVYSPTCLVSTWVSASAWLVHTPG